MSTFGHLKSRNFTETWLFIYSENPPSSCEVCVFAAGRAVDPRYCTLKHKDVLRSSKGCDATVFQIKILEFL